MKLSVIIPTYKRDAILHQCLRHLEAQTIHDALEVIVVSDGHDANTSARIAQSTWHMPVLYEEVEKSQQGTARNQGVQKASAPLCLFIGDDIFLAPNACEVHVERHATLQIPSAVLGYTTWDPAVGITPVMRWLERSGWQFGYPAIANHAGQALPPEIQHRYTYTSHISVSTSVARKLPFDEGALQYGWEDIAWGAQLRDLGIPLVYEPRAFALHHHRISEEQSLKRMETLGESAASMESRQKKFDRVPHGLKRALYTLASALPTRTGAHRKAFLRGIAKVEKSTYTS